MDRTQKYPWSVTVKPEGVRLSFVFALAAAPVGVFHELPPWEASVGHRCVVQKVLLSIQQQA